jgi:hypothetical protein
MSAHPERTATALLRGMEHLAALSRGVVGYDELLPEIPSDSEALREDWARVGKDLELAFREWNHSRERADEIGKALEESSRALRMEIISHLTSGDLEQFAALLDQLTSVAEPMHLRMDDQAMERTVAGILAGVDDSKPHIEAAVQEALGSSLKRAAG